MKKFFTLVALTSVFVIAARDMRTNVSTNIPTNVSVGTQQYYRLKTQISKLKTLIGNVDVEAFKSAFDEVTPLPLEHIEELKKCVFEAKKAIAGELEIMGGENINTFKLVKGISATVAGAAIGMSMPAFFYTISVIANVAEAYKQTYDYQMGIRVDHIVIAEEALRIMYETKTGIYLLALLGGLPYDVLSRFDFAGISNTPTGFYSIITATSILYMYLSYKGIKYGCKNIREGLNHTQYLLDKLEDLDTIKAYISIAEYAARNNA